MEEEKIEIKLLKRNFLVEVPKFSEEETDDEGLVSTRDEVQKIKVLKVSEHCTELKPGDHIIMGLTAQPIVVLPYKGRDYAIFNENIVEAIF